jgi:hypothetical protein
MDKYVDSTTGCVVSHRSCFKSTTGFHQGNHDVWKSKTKGILRVNVATHWNVSKPGDLLQGRFESRGIEEYRQTNSLLLGRRLEESAPIDAHLVTIRSADCGHIDFKSEWKSSGVRIVSSSFHNRTREQETMLLIPAAATITTTLGEWGILWNSKLAYLGLV